jgi:putative oxidoreductase
MTGLGLVALRLGLAVVFVAHGAQVLFGAWGGPGVGPGGIAATAAFYLSLGLQPATLLAVLAGLIQLIGGLCLGLGLFSRPAVIALGAYIGVGAWTVHRHWGFFLNWMGVAGRREGLEYSIVIAAALVCLLVAGPGAWSVDGRRSTRAEARAAGRARLRGKV